MGRLWVLECGMADRDPKTTQHFGFLLLPRFALMSYAAATEPLRAANLLSGVPLYRVSDFSADGAAVRASNGLAVPCAAPPAPDLHTLFVCAGGGPGDWRVAEVAPILRRLARRGVRLGGISGGAYLLAAAGLLDGRDFTLHWEHAPALAEAYPEAVPRPARYVIDGNRITCGGGVAPLDMMHALIAERMGAGFARRVSDWYLHTAVAEPGAPQRASAAERYRTHHPALLAALGRMEATVEAPLPRAAIARSAGVSPRHLDRLFAAELGTTWTAAYLRLRLDQAARLLEQSPLSLAEVAFATGFSSASHFSRAFRAANGVPPGAWRARRVGGTGGVAP
ncbi:MAG: GlxA family transcriptional regulator [Amaricoccus sp.]|uniref:GlxA family transcriptional regulator n=1 Tax=Amaricoccus sp. TaxID=1872485 RepID=UPI0039E3FB2C